MYIYVTDPTESIGQLMGIMREFGLASGLHINRNKTVVFPLGNTRGLDDRIPTGEGLSWEKHHFRYLGIQITRDPEEQYHLNMGRVITGLRNSIQF